jgi:hypothetical protein
MGLIRRRNLMPTVVPVPPFAQEFTLMPEFRRNSLGEMVMAPRVLWVVVQFDRTGRTLASSFFSDSGPTFSAALRCGRDYSSTLAPAQWVAVGALPAEPWGPVAHPGLTFPRPRLVWRLSV